MTHKLALSMVLLAATAAVAQDDAKPFRALVAEYDAAAQKDLDAAVAAFVPRFGAAAENVAGKPEAVPYLCWIVRHAFAGKPAGVALATLANDHAADPGIADIVDMVPALAPYLGERPVRAALDRFVDAAGHPETTARALIARASLAASRAKVDDDQRAAAQKDLDAATKLAKDPATVARLGTIDLSPRGLGRRDLAPDITGIDLDGAPFRLADYRGKVVVLDFWGDW